MDNGEQGAVMVGRSMSERVEERLESSFVGRRDEIADVLAAAARAEGQSTTQLYGVSAPAGYGKSTLLHQVAAQQPAGFVAYGRFDVLGARPYAGIAGALDQTVTRLAALPDTTRAAWASTLRTELGSSAAALAELVHGLARHLEIRRAPTTTGANSVLRLHAAVVSLVRSAAEQMAPLSLVVDDLQWAEPAAIDLLADLADSEIGGLLVVGAWRSGEAPAAELLFGSATTELELLERGAVARFIGEVIGSEPTHDVLEVVERRTKGHPLFLRELLRRVVGDGTLRPSTTTDGWTWDRERLDSLPLADGFVDLLRSTMDCLTPARARVISDVACLGTAFDFRDAVAASGDRPDVVREALDQGVREHLLTRTAASVSSSERQASEATYRFSHDRIAEIACDRLEPVEQRNARLRLGRALRQRDDDRLFDTVTHLSASLDLVADATERDDFVVLAARAGRRARQQAAFSLTLAYYSAALEALDDGASAPGELRSELLIGAAEAAWVLGDENLDALLAAAIDQPDARPVDRARTALLRLKVDLAEHRPERALAVGREALEELGVRLPRRLSKPRLLLRVLRTANRLRRASDGDLLGLPVSTDPVTAETMSLMLEFGTALYAVEPDLFPFPYLAAIDMTLDQGRCPASSVAFGGYALMMTSTNRFDDAQRYGDLAMRLADDKDAETHRPWTLFFFYDFVNHWRRPASDSVAGIRAAVREAIQVGDIEYGAYMVAASMGIAFYAGEPLADIDAYGTAQLPVIKSQTKQVELVRASLQMMRNLQGEGDPVALVGSTTYDEAVVVPRAEASADQVTLSVHWYAKLMAACFSGDYRSAVEFGERLEHHLVGLAGTIVAPLSVFATAFSQAIAGTDERVPAQVNDAVKHFERLAATCPENFAAPLAILRAEAARRRDRRSEAKRLHEEAINHAGRHDNPLFGALAYERRALLEPAGSPLARPFWQASLDLWRRCGNQVKVRQIEGAGHVEPAPSPLLHSRTEPGGDIGPEQLVATVAALTDARRVVYLRADDSGLTATAVMDVDDPHFLDHQPLPEDAYVASLARFVAEDRDPVFIVDSSASTYRKHPRVVASPDAPAIAALPLEGRRGLVGVIYLERDRGLPLAPEVRRQLIETCHDAAAAIEVHQLAERLVELDADRNALVAVQSRLVPPRFLRAFGLSDVRELESRQHVEAEGTIAFVDIKGSVSKLEDRDGFAAVELIADFTERVGAIVEAHGGVAISLRGDMVLAFFESGPNAAVRAGFELVETRRLRNRELRPDQQAEHWRIGMHHGVSAITALGTGDRLSIEVIGDTVNVGHRLQDQASERNIEVLVSRAVRDLLDDDLAVRTRLVTTTEVANRSEPVTMYALLTEPTEPDAVAGQQQSESDTLFLQ